MENGEAKGWKPHILAGILSLVCLSLFTRPTGAAGIRQFTDGQGVIHITNLGEAKQEPVAPKSPPAPEPRPTPLSPETKPEAKPEIKPDKVQTAETPPAEKKPAESLEPSDDEDKTAPENEEDDETEK